MNDVMKVLQDGDLDALLSEPELAPLKGCQQNRVMHPEGDAWEHTKLVIKNVREFAEQYEMMGQKAMLLLLALLHDVGKPLVTTVHPEKGIVAYKHGQAGVPLAKAFLERHGVDEKTSALVLAGVEVHMQAHTMDKTASEKAWRKLDERFPLELLWFIGRCDMFAGKGNMETDSGCDLVIEAAHKF